jgi:multicomponent Na+:H+ antiporter subunit C
MSEVLYLAAGAGLFALGAFYAFTSPELLRKVLAVNVMGNGVFLVLLTRARRDVLEGSATDPVPHALVLTGIVVAAAATGLAISLSRRLDDEDPP